MALQVTIAFDGTFTFSFDEGDTTEDAATLAVKLIPDLPDVSGLGLLSNGASNGASDPHDAANFAADFAKAAALPQVSMLTFLPSHDVNEVQHVKHAAVGKAGK